VATQRYIRLVNTGATLDKKFRVIFQDFHSPTIRRQNIKEMADGSLDIQSGAHYRVWPLLLKVYYIDPEEDQGFGSLANMEIFFGYRLPGNRNLVLYDNLGRQFTVWIDGDYDPMPQTPILDGEQSWYLVPIMLRQTTPK